MALTRTTHNRLAGHVGADVDAVSVLHGTILDHVAGVLADPEVILKHLHQTRACMDLDSHLQPTASHDVQKRRSPANHHALALDQDPGSAFKEAS